MAKGSVDKISLSKQDGRTKTRVALKFTSSAGLTVDLKTSPANPPTDDMIDMAHALADYLSTGKPPKGWTKSG